MNRRFNIIQLSGLRGILLILFLICCAATGFLVFPGWICMHLWNYAASFVIDAPTMVLYQGVMLWCILGLMIFVLNKNSVAISFKSVSPGEERIKRIMQAQENNIALHTKEHINSEEEETIKK